ncbi:MAG: NnrS family protein [Minicystis sp.]
MEPRESPLLSASIRAEPYRVFFPLAVALGAAGVAPWLLLGAGATSRYLGVFHALTQMESFMLALAAGFLLTAVPKRTRSAPASGIEIAALALLLPAIPAAAFLDHYAAAQIAYIGALLVLAQFAVRRLAGGLAGRRPPASFALVPVGILAGITGAAMSLATTIPGAPAWLGAGRAFVLEGVFLCLVLGVGAFFFGLALRGEAAPDVPSSTRGRATMAAHALAGVAILAGLLVEQLGAPRVGLLLRAAVVLAVFGAAGAFRYPSRPGLNRRLVWLAGLAVPAGLVTAAIFPEHRIAAMHLLYVGGFGLMGLTVAAHVALGHGGFTADQEGRPGAVVAFGVLFLAAAVLRASAGLVPAAYLAWLGAAAAFWLAGACVWAAYLIPKMWIVRASEEHAP